MFGAHHKTLFNFSLRPCPLPLATEIGINYSNKTYNLTVQFWLSKLCWISERKCKIDSINHVNFIALHIPSVEQILNIQNKQNRRNYQPFVVWRFSVFFFATSFFDAAFNRVEKIRENNQLCLVRIIATVIFGNKSVKFIQKICKLGRNYTWAFLCLTSKFPFIT